MFVAALGDAVGISQTRQHIERCRRDSLTVANIWGGAAAAETIAAGVAVTEGAIAGGLLGGAVAAIAGSGGSGSDSGHMIGENATQTNGNVSTWNKGQYRIDVENPKPCGRDGQMHFQDQSGRIPKCQYNFDTGEFDGLPKSVAKQLAKDPSFQRGIQQGLKILGE